MYVSQCHRPHRPAGVSDHCGLAFEHVRTRRLVYRFRHLVLRDGRDSVPHAKPTATGRRHGPLGTMTYVVCVWKTARVEPLRKDDYRGPRGVASLWANRVGRYDSDVQTNICGGLFPITKSADRDLVTGKAGLWREIYESLPYPILGVRQQPLFFGKKPCF